MKTIKPITHAVRLSLLASSTMFLTPSTLLAEEAETDGSIEQIVVTGSRIKRSDIESAQPVTIISADDIEKLGSTSVAEVLRDLPFATAGSFLPQSGNSAANHASTGLRGLSADRTLVLVNGRRLANGSTAGATQANLQNIPSSAIDQIEILRDGASAVYGSDAIGGVINIRLKNDYEGVRIDLHHGNPTRGSADEKQYALTFGSTSDKSQMTMILEHKDDQGLKGGERPHLEATGRSDIEAESFYATGVLNPAGGYRPVRFVPERNRYVTDGLFVASPDCDPNNIDVRRTGSFCRYPIFEGRNFLPSRIKNSLFWDLKYDVNDSVQLFSQFFILKEDIDVESPPLWTSTERREGRTQGRYPILEAGHPNNPTNGDIEVIQLLKGVADRKSSFETLSRALVGGVNWFTEYGDLEVFYSMSKNETDVRTNHYVFTPNLIDAIENGSYNPFVPGGNASQDVLDDILHTYTRETFAENRSGGFSWAGELPFEFGADTIKYSFGAEYQDEQFADIQDSQTVAGNVLGAFGGNSGGKRNSYGMFVETSIMPIENLTVDMAVRRDAYSFPDEASTVGSIRVGYSVMDNLKLRASFSQGFRAPSLDDLLAEAATSYDTVIDRTVCNAARSAQPGKPISEIAECGADQELRVSTGNRNLKPEESEQISFGVVADITDDINVTLDVYEIAIENQVAYIGSQTLLDMEAAGTLGFLPQFSVIRDADGGIEQINSGYTNIAGDETKGADLEFNWGFELGEFGQMRWKTLASYVFEYTRQLSPGVERLERVGLIGRPEIKGVTSLEYAYEDLGAYLSVNYVGEYEGVTAEQKADDVQRQDFDAYMTTNLSVFYTTDYGKFTIGAKNLLDELPDVNYELGYPGYDSDHTNILGRVVYGKYSIEF